MNRPLDQLKTRELEFAGSFSLAETCGPVAWGRNRWPNVDWIDNAFVWVGWECDRVCYRRVVQESVHSRLLISGSGSEARDRAWAEAVLGAGSPMPDLDEPHLQRLSSRWSGLRPFAAGSIFDGLIGAIVGQSISVVSAATTEARLCAHFHEGVSMAGRTFWPLPRPEQLANASPDLVRTSGVTWRRAEALVEVGRAALEELIPTAQEAVDDPERSLARLLQLRLVGLWTAQSTLLWGIGHPDAHPTGDVALLRAARLVFENPELDLKALDRLAERWRPNRGWVARLLWAELLGGAPVAPSGVPTV
jgi:DNA-3-methyladenine glycosylase II